MDLQNVSISQDLAFHLRTCPLSEITGLIKKIGSVNVRGFFGDTALHDLNDSPERCKILIDNGANVNSRGRCGRTPLHLVENPEVCKVLLENGADVNARDSEGQTPLHHLRNVEVCQKLIEYGADINATAAYGWTPLMNVTHREDSDGFENYYHLLLYYNADARMKDDENKNALCQSLRRLFQEGHLDLIEILFNSTYDQIQEPIYWKLIMEMAGISELSHIFKQLVETCSEIDFPNVNPIQEQSRFLQDLFQFDPDNLRIFLKKFIDTIVRSLKCVRNYPEPDGHRPFRLSDDFEKSKEILNILVEYNLLEEFMKEYKVECSDLMEKINDLQQMTEIVLIFLSYGSNFKDVILDELYTKFGYCQLFRILLHCDLMETDQFHWNSPMARFIYNINLSVAFFNKNPPFLSKAESCILQLLEQFAQPNIVEFYRSKYQSSKDIMAKINTMPKIPKLVELARNTVREHIVKKFNFGNSRQFYTYLQHLKMSQVYKDILSFRRKLYV